MQFYEIDSLLNFEMRKETLILFAFVFFLALIGYLYTNKVSYVWISVLTIIILVIIQKRKLFEGLTQSSKNKKNQEEKIQMQERDENDEREEEEQDDNEQENNNNDNSNNEKREERNQMQHSLNQKKRDKFNKNNKREKKKNNLGHEDEEDFGETQVLEAADGLSSEGFQNLDSEISWSPVKTSMNPLVDMQESRRASSFSPSQQQVGGKLSSSHELNEFMQSNYTRTSKQNPFGNVLLTEIVDDPQRKSAPPSFNPQVNKNITESIKDIVQDLNPTIENSNKQLFGDLYNNFELDQSNRQFFSTPNTRIPNDQGAFAHFLYGNMPSGKLDPEAMVQDNLRYLLY